MIDHTRPAHPCLLRFAGRSGRIGGSIVMIRPLKISFARAMEAAGARSPAAGCGMRLHCRTVPGAKVKPSAMKVDPEAGGHWRARGWRSAGRAP